VLRSVRYFSASSDLSISSWTTEDSDALTGCGHCDNCTRKPGSVNRRDVTLEAWQVLKVSEAVHNSNGRLTISMLAEMVRGTGSGTVKGKGRESEKITVDLEAIAGGKINLSRDVSTHWPLLLIPLIPFY
jgi:ATP-dependent DNA helicase Q1